MKHLISLMLGLLVAGAALAQPRIAVTDLAYTQEVAEYFEVATIRQSGSMSAHANANSAGMAANVQTQGTYVAGTSSYVEQRELGSFSNDIKGSLLKGTGFRLVQGKLFDSGEPRNSKAEDVLNQVKTGKVAKPVRQPQVMDIVARIRKGEFNGADYVLFGTLTSLQFRDSVTQIQGTANASHIFSLDLVADFSLISTKTYEIVAAFSAEGAGSDTKLLSTRLDILPPNRGKVIRETSKSLAGSVFDQLSEQVALADRKMSGQIRPEPQTTQQGVARPAPTPKSEVTILR
jgi:curli biogenesis system outer membrane secretion channel CsgG